MGGDHIRDKARVVRADAAVTLAKLSEIKIVLSRLISEQRKAQKRDNALRYNVGPHYRETIRYIEAALEEEKRNTLFQIRVLRERGPDTQILETSVNNCFE